MQIKTHAKKRYLKKKKERKKLKKVTASTRPKTKPTTQDSDSENIAENDISDGEVSQTSERESSVEASPKRAKKKRSRVEGVEGEKENDDMVVDKEDAITAERAPSPPFESSKQPAPLPFFPLPTLPNTPSKSALALQGLDRALVDAQLVSPSITLAVPSGNEDGGTRLNEKLRKRLHDIGITELFAGKRTNLGRASIHI